ncbi:TorD/DmsD family molecular chaperone [Faunimonas sp. B44]|uniref:TorD/DmsD family molecular chaperone n=1 Tax=Faunimonas sp. B44 TaxID=3461493 RepID=UPI004044B7F1
MTAFQSRPEVDETDLARSHLYALLAGLLLRAPDAAMLAQLSAVQGTATPIGLAQIALAEAAASTSVADAQQEYFDLFIGVGRGELLPYASYYLTGFLNERPLARLRGDLRRLGLERAEGHREPEDHLGTLCEIMSGFACGAFEASPDDERRFFLDHIAPWAPRFFADLEMAKRAKLYAPVGRIGGLFMDIESEAFALDA